MKKLISAAALCLLMTACSSQSTSVSRTVIPAAAETSAVTEIPAAASEEPDKSTTEEAAESAPLTEAESRAAELLSAMTIEEKVGQLFIVRYPGASAAVDAAQYHLGGYIMFAQDFENSSPDEIRAEIADCNSAGLPMLFGADEEGGTVVRISKYPQFRDSRFPSQAEVFGSGGSEAVNRDAADKSELLRSLGLNMNFAPVCDLPRTEQDFIYDRAFSTNADDVSECVRAAVCGYNDNGVVSVLKHFPGYGDNSDTHTGIAVDERDISVFREFDLLPFEAGISAGAPVVMVSHNIVSCLDDSTPASLSAAVHELLRNELGFDGVIVTDDLAMGAITDFAGVGQAAVMAVQAGNDLLCSDDYRTEIPAVLEAVRSGEITEERIDESVTRILLMKINYGIIP